LVITRKLAKANPISAEAHRDLSISLERLGNIAARLHHSRLVSVPGAADELPW
jgi:hypothetical protein